MKFSVSFCRPLSLNFLLQIIIKFETCWGIEEPTRRAEDQLSFWRLHNGNFEERSTNQNGCPIQSLTSTLKVGRRGPLLLQDSNYLDHLAHFDRERIPERVVHAKGGGAFGYFEVTRDITHLTSARVFETIGKKTPVVVRMSTSLGESGSADTVRDVRGFSVKFYTGDGNWDLAGFNIENFAIRDPILFPSLIHSRKRNPVTHLRDANMFWDFISLRPESTLNTLFSFSDRGIPDGFRHMHGFGIHAFKFVNKEGVPTFVKFQWLTDQGLKDLIPADAVRIAGTDPDYAIRDLYNAIADGRFPSWTLAIQVMTAEEAEKLPYNPFDLTKVWLLNDFPLLKIGKMVLNRNPEDYFTDVEQAIFHPGNLVPGIEPSPDLVLQGRIFSYSDTQRYRLGVNFLQLPVNKPHVRVATYERDGHSCFSDNGAGSPNYFPNSFGGPVEDLGAMQLPFRTKGYVKRQEDFDDDYYSQAQLYWEKALTEDERQRLVQNVAEDLSGATEDVRSRVLEKIFDPVSQGLGNMLRDALDRVLKTNYRK